MLASACIEAAGRIMAAGRVETRRLGVELEGRAVGGVGVLVVLQAQEHLLERRHGDGVAGDAERALLRIQVVKQVGKLCAQSCARSSGWTTGISTHGDRSRWS